MSSANTSEMRSSATKRTRTTVAANRDIDFADQIDALRADIQALSSTVTRIANRQLSRAQDKAIEAAQEAEDALRRNPISAVAIAVGLGFLCGVFMRR